LDSHFLKLSSITKKDIKKFKKIAILNALNIVFIELEEIK